MAPMPTTRSTDAMTESTSVNLNTNIHINNGIGVTSIYNYNSATVPVVQQTPADTGIGRNLGQNYSASGVQIIPPPVSRTVHPNLLTNSSSTSCSLVQAYDHSQRSLNAPTWHTPVLSPGNFSGCTNVSANSNLPILHQQPLSSMGSITNATLNQANFSHYGASINSVIANVNTQHSYPNSISTVMPSSLSSSSSYVVKPPPNGKCSQPIRKKKKEKSNGVAKETVLRIKKIHSAARNATASSTYASPALLNIPTASSNVSFVSSYNRASHLLANFPSTAPVPVASQVFVSSSSYNSANSYVPNFPVLPSTSGLQDLPTASTTWCSTPVPASTSPPLPPNWNEHLEDTVLSLAPYKLFPIDSNTLEYATLAALMNQTQILEAEQIVNPTLWSRFVNTRKDMLRSKTDDLQLLLKLGLDEAEIMRSAHLSLNFNKDPSVAAYPYNDNMALLFHCTRSKTNLENILSQGLDERVGNTGGLLGRGIYFADDPNKCMIYDGCDGIMFIFAVLLGDCLSVDHLPNKNSFVREPEKQTSQKRNFNDFNFDSIVAQPGSIHNEYVVYNRYQCCPLYKIKYQRNYGMNFGAYNRNLQSKNKLPSLSWIPATAHGSSTVEMPNPLANTSNWPFYASAIFSQMGVVQKVKQIQEAPAVDSVTSIDEKLAMMVNLGFTDADLNLKTLKRYEYDLDRSVNFLLDQSAVLDEECVKMSTTPVDFTTLIDLTDSPDSTPNTSFNNCNTAPEDVECPPKKAVHNDLSMSACAPSDDAVLQDIYDWVVSYKSEDGTNSPTEQQLEDCSICCNEYDTDATYWAVLECSHKVCTVCYNQIETTRTTMKGVTHTFVKCPFCQYTTGIEIGTCPNGTMTELIVASPCAGYEQYTTISIRYNVSSHGLNRIVYMPNNDQGNELLKLLRLAWDRRLCFTIGTSVTTGQENTLVWNIHHKTAQQGGVQRYGYPDPTYFERVKLELKAYGIES